MVWAGAAVGWASGDVVSGAPIRVAIAAFVGSKAFSAFTKYTAFSWDVDELSSTINGDTED